MPDRNTQLGAAIGDLDDGYLQVMLLIAVRRASSEEPSRGAFWHALAGLLAEEQEERRKGSELEALSSGAGTGVAAGSAAGNVEGAGTEPARVAAGAVEAVLAELRLDIETLESESALQPAPERPVADDSAGAG